MARKANRPSPDQVFADAVNAQIALGTFLFRARDQGDLDLDHLALDIADPLVAKVEEFVKAYRKRYGSPVR